MNEQTFLSAILATPDDDVTRLAYADWLMEQDDANACVRGEFIQVQVQLARRVHGGSPGEWADADRLPALEARQRELIEKHGKDWAGPVVGVAEGYQFARGFVESIRIDPTAFLQNAPLLFARSPIQRVHFPRVGAFGVFESPWLGRVVELDLGGCQMGNLGLRPLLASKHLGQLRSLSLRQCNLTDNSLAVLAQSPLLGQLESLNLGYNYIGLPGITGLFSSPFWGKVRSLTLTGNHAIDARAQQYIVQTLQGTHDASLLRVMLQTASREEREYTGAKVRDLARRAGQDPSGGRAVLSEGLHDGNRKIRSAAAQMLAHLGPAGTPAVPQLVQCLLGDTKLVRDHAAPALARLLHELPPEVQRWLCVLANPLLPARANLRAAIESFDLPPTVSADLAALCNRRVQWWNKLIQGEATVSEGFASLSDAVNATLLRAGQHAGRHDQGLAKDSKQKHGENREAAWLVARLVERIQEEYPAVPAVPEPATKRRGRWK